MKTQAAVLFLITTLSLFCSPEGNCQRQPVKIIFDTDMGPDYDDVGALTMLHAFADKGEAELLATIASTQYNGVATVLDILNTYFRRPDLAVGVPKGNALQLKDFQHWTDTLIARYPYSIKSNEEAADAVTLCRRILASQPDQSVTIVTVGFLTNIAGLLQSLPDEHSTLNGIALVEKKVHRLVSMAGAFPSGHEFNVKMDAASASYVFNHFPRPILLSGVEIGFPIKTGLQLTNNTEIKNSPVKDVYRMCMAMTTEDTHGRSSWDQTAVLVAVRGHEPWFDVKEGRIISDAEGRNEWDHPAKGHCYLIQKSERAVVAKEIEGLMMHQPNNH
jgi:pyrimidine-specific ribonucleoside hydrolase